MVSCTDLVNGVKLLELADNTQIGHRSIQNICDFITDDHSVINRFIEFSEVIFDRVFSELSDRMMELTKKLIHNVN